uniref:Zinc finger, CCHC-type n=1 Tax=Tanacetum cinerariifolium TaxID=118510 RepID=A0A6L2JIP4_TANCI|nr:zinc finger, CCHC-type [Tanacetum cinerariifolium]
MILPKEQWKPFVLRAKIKKIKESLCKFMAESAKRHEENSNLIKEIQASTDVAIRNQGTSIKALEIQIEQISKTDTSYRAYRTVSYFCAKTGVVPFPSRLYDDCYDEEEGSCGLKNFDAYSIGTTLLDDALPPKEKDPGSFTLPCYINNLCFNKALADLGVSVSVMPFSTYTNLGLGELAPTKLIVELAERTKKHPKGIAENVLVGIDKFVFLVYFIMLDIPKDIKTPLILGRPFLSTAHAKIYVFKRKITLKVGNDKVVFKSDKPTSNIIKMVYSLSLREMMELDLEAMLMGEALILNRSLDPLYGDYIKLNDLNEPLELRRNLVDDLEPTIKEEPGDGVTFHTRRRHTSSSDGVTYLKTASARTDSNADLEDSFYDGVKIKTRRRHILVMLPLVMDVHVRLWKTSFLSIIAVDMSRLWSEDPNQHLKDFLKLVDSLDLNGENRERTRLRLFQFSLRDHASNWLERLPAGSISTWEDLTTRFLAQFFPLGRTAKLHNDILMFQQHQEESLSEAWTRFKDLLRKVPHHGIDIWIQV